MTADSLLEQIRKDCQQVGFDWPSTDTNRTGPPERVIYHDQSVIRHAVWHRSKLLGMVDAMQRKLDKCREIMECNDPLNARDLFGEPK